LLYEFDHKINFAKKMSKGFYVGKKMSLPNIRICNGIDQLMECGCSCLFWGEKSPKVSKKSRSAPCKFRFQGWNPVIFTWKHHDTLKGHLKTSSHCNHFVCPMA
jgi:hypothetical protein